MLRQLLIDRIATGWRSLSECLDLRRREAANQTFPSRLSIVTDALFNIGDHVRRRSAPDKSGVVKDRYRSDQTNEWIYKVHFGSPPAKSVPGTDLEPVPTDQDPWQDLIDGRYESVAVYHKLLTFERIN